MKKLTFTSVFSQLLLLLFVIAWIVPTFGLFISSLRDKDVLAISGWWTSFTTTEVNEIYRTKGKEDQIKEGDYYFIKSNLFDENQGKEIYRFGITSKNIDEYEVGETALFKDETEITVFENGDYVWKSKEEFKKKTSAGQVGKNYMRHLTASVYALMDKPVNMHRGTTMAGIITDESRNDPSRGFVGGYEMETLSLGLPFMAAFLVPGTTGYGPKMGKFLDNYDHMAGMWIVG